MNDVLRQLTELLNPQTIDDDHFRCESQDLGFRAMFGGQAVGQALASAMKTTPVEGDWSPHSLHVYFLLPGTVSDPVFYQVERLRDGRSFCNRQVKAIQNDRVILTMNCSFQIHEEGFSHQAEMPQVKGPDGILSQLELARMFRDYFPDKVRDIYTADKPIEMRVLDPVNVFDPQIQDPVRYVWIKATAPLPDDDNLHRALLAYTSDFNMLATSLHPHGHVYGQKGMQMASIDHAVWFHRPFRMDEGLLYAIDSPNASGARGYSRGQFFTQDGVLVASTAQEGLIRYVPEVAK